MLTLALDRRSFLAGASAASLYPIVSGEGWAQSRPPSATARYLVRESGACGDWPLVIGVLIASDPNSHSKAIGILRQEAGYTRELKYSSTDEHRLQYAIKLIDYFVGRTDLLFRALVVADETGSYPDIARDRDARYFAKYRQLLEPDPEEPPGTILIQRKETQRNERLHSALQDLNTVVERQEGQLSDLMQLAGLLSGCVRADRMGATETKKEIVDHLKRALNVSQLNAVSEGQFRISTTNI